MGYKSLLVNIGTTPMSYQQDYTKWTSIINESTSSTTVLSTNTCNCDKWDCPKCFPDKEISDGVKLGKLVANIAPKSTTDGSKSPLTYGDDNLDESMPDESDEISFDSPLDRQDYMDELSQIAPDEAMGLISSILNMQDMGFSNSDTHYTEDDFIGMNASNLRKIHQAVTGRVSEAINPKPTKTRAKDYLDDLDDMLNPSEPDLPATIGGSDDDYNDSTLPSQMSLPSASKQTTTDKLRHMTPSDTMRDFMSRINPLAGAGEPELDHATSTDLVVRTASDVPAVISSAMVAAGVETPDWHNVNNLPGFANANIRGMGRKVFGMFTSTPVEHIQTVANVGGQGPNTDAEMRSVAGWLRDNAEDLGRIVLDHGAAIPGYEPDVKEYRINGVRFHVVRDPMGQYIYAYPDKDARTLAITLPDGNQNLPRLRESGRNIRNMFNMFSIYENLKFDETLVHILKEDAYVGEAYGKPSHAERKARTIAGHDKRTQDAFMTGDELPPELPPEKSQLSRVLGKMDGGKKLIRYLHSIHKLSNEANLTPIKVNSGKNAAQLSWHQFNNNPDDFVIVAGAKGVAGIKPNKASVEKYKATAAKKGKQPMYAKHGGAIMYDIVAFSSDGTHIPNTLLQPADVDHDAITRANDALDDFRDVGEPKLRAIKARMGLVHGTDPHTPDNVFNLLNNEIGPLTSVWLAGWEGERGNYDGEVEEPKSPGAVDRDKLKHRADLVTSTSPEKFNFPDRVSQAKLYPTPATARQALDSIFTKTLTSSRLKRMIGSTIETLIRGEKKAQQAGLRAKAADFSQRILKLEELQTMTLTGDSLSPATKSSFITDTKNSVASLIGNISPDGTPYTPQQKAAEVDKYIINLAKSSSPDLYKPFIKTLMSKISKEGLSRW